MCVGDFCALDNILKWGEHKSRFGEIDDLHKLFRFIPRKMIFVGFSRKEVIMIIIIKQKYYVYPVKPHQLP